MRHVPNSRLDIQYLVTRYTLWRPAVLIGEHAKNSNLSPASPLHLSCPMRQFVIGSGVSMNLKILQDRSKMIPEPGLELQIFSQTRKQKLPVLKYSQRRLTENDCSRAFSKKDNRVDELFSFAFVKIC